ncbi:MAG: putative sulfate/molybdate transporter [Actinomycetales bacterium]|nr:putative sulfate/molybdate transporter [Candidatus Phosphoribacter baldrii]
MPRRPEPSASLGGPLGGLDRREVAGALADLGVLVPIVVALILVNGLSASAVLLPAGLLYLAAGAFYRVPIPVQPLKAFGAIAIAQGLGADVIAAGSLLMAAVFIPLGVSGLLDRAAAVFPKPLVRGVQLSVGILLVRLAWGLVVESPKQFADAGTAPVVLVGAAVAAGAAAYLWRSRGITVALVGVALVWVVARGGGPVAWGPSELRLHVPSAADFATAAVVLVLPQLPLTFANSCIATADAARGYFGAAASRVSAGRLAVTLGLGNVVAGVLGGMPVCHGAGGLTAHRSFGARTGRAPMLMGGVLVVLALVGGVATARALTGFPVWILAALLGVAGVLHIQLLRDLRGRTEWGFAIGVGVVGALVNLAVALGLGLVAWWVVALIARRRAGLARGPEELDAG